MAAALLAGCAGRGPAPATPSVATAEPGNDATWQRVRFYNHWPPDEAPGWHLDALLAHRVVGPALARHRDAIALWRFHRRAGRDDAGHSLSFLAYAPAATNTAICSELRSDPLVGELLQARVLDKLHCTSEGPAIAATSDPGWAPEIQRTWPRFIMGVSETWLALIDEFARQNPPGETVNLEATLAQYRQIEDRMTTAWSGEGGHAFLHHLNAVFGYGPVYIHRERRLQRF